MSRVAYRILGVGVDVVSIPRIQALHATRGAQFVQRAYHESERAHIDTLQCEVKLAEYLASRWAVKEAVYKAIGGEWRLAFDDVAVASGESGKPTLLFADSTWRKMKKLGVARHHVSLSHDAEVAMAQVILEEAHELK